MFNNIKKGDIYFAHLPEQPENPHVQEGDRYILVISADKANYFSPVISCLPITKQKKDISQIGISGLEIESWVICNQIIPLNKRNLLRFHKKATDEEMILVDAALDIYLQKDFAKNDKKIQRKAKIKASSILELEDFIIKNKHSIDVTLLERNLQIQVNELKEYCKVNRIEIGQFYTSKILEQSS